MLERAAEPVELGDDGLVARRIRRPAAPCPALGEWRAYRWRGRSRSARTRPRRARRAELRDADRASTRARTRPAYADCTANGGVLDIGALHESRYTGRPGNTGLAGRARACNADDRSRTRPSASAAEPTACNSPLEAPGPASGDKQVDRRPVYAALLSRRHRHRSDRLSLPDRARAAAAPRVPPGRQS